MSNEDSKTRLLNILKWLETYQGSTSQLDTPSLSIDCGNPSSDMEQSTDDNKLKQCIIKYNPAEKSPCRDSSPAIVKIGENMITSSSSSTSDTKMSDEEKFNCVLANDRNTCELEHSSAMSRDDRQINANAKLGLELSDVQTTNTSTSSKETDKSSSKTISANADLLQDSVDEIPENLQSAVAATGSRSSGGDGGSGEAVAEKSITVSNVDGKTLEDPLASPDDESEVISESESLLTEKKNGESNSNLFEQDFVGSKTLEKQSLEKVVTEVGCDKTPTEQTCGHSENSNEIIFVESDRPFPRIENVLVCPQTDPASPSNSTGIIDPLINEGDKVKQYGSPQPIIQSKYSVVPEHNQISSNLNPNDNPQTALNHKNTNIQYLGKKLDADGNSARKSSPDSKASTSSIVEETQEATIKSKLIKDKSLNENCCTFSSSVNSTDRNMAAEQNDLLDSNEVKIKHQKQTNNEFVKTGSNYRDKKEIPEKHLNKSSTMNAAMTATANLSNPVGEEADIYKTCNMSNYPSVYNSSQFKNSFTNSRPYSINNDRCQIPEQCYQECQPLYYANMSMNKSSDLQYVFYPNSVNSASSTFCYSPQFQCNSVSDYIGGSNDGLVMSPNIFSNHQRTNFKPFGSPYMVCLQKTPPTTSVNEENTNINGIRDFLENCQSLQNAYVNVPEMSNQDQYTVLQNTVLTSAQQKQQQQLYPNIYNKGNQPDYLVYKPNRLAHNSNDCIKNFNQFMSSQELYSQINNSTVKYPSNPPNPDFYQSKPLINVRSIQCPTVDSNARNMSLPISNGRTDNVTSPKQYLTQNGLQQRMESVSQHRSINERFDSNIQNEVKSQAEVDLYNNMTGCSVNPLKDGEINRNNMGYLKPNNYIQLHSTANNMFRSSFNTGVNSGNSLPQFHQRHYNSNVIHPDNFRDIMTWIPKPSRNIPCDSTKVINKDMEDTAKIPHQVQQQKCSNLSMSEIKKNGCVSENGQYLQNQMYDTSQPLLSQIMGHHQNLASEVSSPVFELQHPTRYTQPSVSNEHNDTETSTETTQNENTQCSFNTSILSPIDSSESRINYFRSQYSSGPNGQAENNFQTINEPSNAQQIPESKQCREETGLQELNESNFCFLDNDFLGESLIDEGKSFSAFDGTYDGSKSGQSSDMTNDESFLFSDYDPVFLANLLTNDFDPYNDCNSAFDEGFEDAASITMTNSVQTENDFIGNIVSNFESSTHNPDNITVLQNSDNDQHINLSNIPETSGTSVSVLSSSPNDDHKAIFHYDNQMKYSMHPNNGFGSFTRKPVYTRLCPTTQGGIIRQRYPSKAAIYQCTPGQTIYAADMVPRIDIDPQTSKRRYRSTGSVMGPSALVLEEKKSFSYDPEVTKRFSDRCASKTAYQLAESISECEINRGRYIKKSPISKENSFENDTGSKTKIDDRSSMSLSVDNGGFSNRNIDYVYECSTEIQSLNTDLTSKSVTSNVENVQCITKDAKQVPRRPRGRPRLSEEVKRERALKKALLAKSTQKTRIKNTAKINGKEIQVQPFCNPTNKNCNSETDLNLSNDSQQHKSETASDLHGNVTHDNGHSENIENPSSSASNEQIKEKDNENEAALLTPNLNIDLPETPLQLTNEKHLEENGENVSKMELKENGWFDECSHLSQEEQQMKSYLELKKKLDKRQRTNNAPWKCPYLQSKSTNDESRRKFSKRKSMSNYYGSTKRWYTERNYTKSEKPGVTNEDGRHSLNSSCSANEMQEPSKLTLPAEDKLSPKDNNLHSHEMMSVSNRNEFPSMESHAVGVSEQTKPQNISKTLSDLADKRQLSSMSFVRQKPALSEKQNKSQNLSDNCKNKSSSPIAVIHPCTPLPIYPPPPPPLFRLPPPPPLREKKVTPRNVNPTIVENARLCYEAIKHQLSKAESDFDSFLISYANIAQGLQNCGAERYRRIKDILLKTSEMKVTMGNKTSPKNKGVEQSSAAAADISENGGETKDRTCERGTNKILSDIDALSIQGDPSVEEKPLDRNELTDDYTELVKILLTSRADEYRNIKLVISRNICGGTDMKQIVKKSTNQAELEAKKAKLAAYFENVGKIIMMEENVSNVPTKSRGEEKKQKRKSKKSLRNQNGGKTSKFLANLNSDVSNNEIEGQKDRREIVSNRRNSDLEEKSGVDHVSDTKVCDRNYTRNYTGKLKKNSVGRPKKNTIRENPGVLNKQYNNKEEEEKYSEKDENVLELSSSSDGGFVEESTGDYILGLGTESDDDILFNSVKFQTYVSETDSKCPLEEEKNDSKENSVTENFSNVVTSTNEICKRHELKEIIPATPEHTLTGGTEEIGCINAKLSPMKLNTRFSRRQSSRNTSKRKVRCDLSSAAGKDSKTDIQTENVATQCISSFKIRNQSKIVKPKTAVIPKEIRQRKPVKHSQKGRPPKLQKNAKKIDDKPVKDSDCTKDNRNIFENSAKPTIITETLNKRKTLKNVYPTESCTDENINTTFIDSITKMIDTSNIDSVESWKVRKKNEKLKQKHSLKSNSVITVKYFDTLSKRSLESDNYSVSCFPKENVQKRNISFKDYIPKINNNSSDDNDDDNDDDDDDDDDDDWIMEEVLRSDSKDISTDATDNTPRKECKRDTGGLMNVDPLVPDLKVTAESNEHSKNCIGNFGEPLNKSNERKDAMNLKCVEESSKSGLNARRNYNRTFQSENIKDVSDTKVTNSTEELNISKMKNVTVFSENTADDSDIKEDKTNRVCQNQSTIDNRAKYSRLSSKLTKENKKTNSRKREILKIQSINFEKEPVIIKTTTLLKKEKSFKKIHEKKNVFNILFQPAATAAAESSLPTQIESMDGLGNSSSNFLNGQYSKSDVNLLKVWDSKSSKLPVLPTLLKTNILDTGNDRKTLVVNCCRLENNLNNSYSLQSSECTDSTTNSDTKMKPNFTCKGILKDSNASPGDGHINKKVRFSLDNDEEEASSRKKSKRKIHLSESNYKERYCKKNSAVKTSKSGEISKKLINTDEELTHKESSIKTLKSSSGTSISKNLDSSYDITHVGDIVSDACIKDDKPTSKVNHSNTKRTSSRRKKKRPPLICEYCSKQFKKPSQLLYHTRSHTGERPFRCDVCDKAFVSNSHLLRHSRTHSSVKSHVCDTCGRGFSQRYSLLMHENIHTGIKSFKCQKCLITFRTRESLVIHERKYHQDQIHSPKTKAT